MHTSHLLGATALCAGLGLFFASTDPGDSSPGSASAAAMPPASGHFVLVVEGDRDQLTITAASHKESPWAGVPKGFSSKWTLSIRDGAGTELERVPLDMSQFDLQPEQKGRGLRVNGCVVRDARVAMLASAPCHAAAATYVFLRGEDVVGTVESARVGQLAGGGR